MTDECTNCHALQPELTVKKSRICNVSGYTAGRYCRMETQGVAIGLHDRLTDSLPESMGYPGALFAAK
jgi:hypothetical protein